MITRHILIKGPFEDADWAELTALIRKIERRHQESEYYILRLDPDSTVLEAAQLIQDTFPKVDGEHPQIYFQKIEEK